jgi:tetratricopeptide (TPR) repeat protein
VVAVLAAVVLVYFLRAGSERAEERAAGMLAEARADFVQGALEPAATRLDEIIRNMGGTDGGQQALLLYGDVRFHQERYEDAAKYYSQALDTFGKDPLFGAAARRGLATSLENQGKPQEAATVYRELADAVADEGIRQDLLLDVARNYVKAGRVEDALALYASVSEKNQVNPTAALIASMRRAEVERLAGSH